MANRRMISSRIINSMSFLELPLSAQALYFHLILDADDDGVVEAWVILKKTGAKIGDLKALNEIDLVRFLNDKFVAIVTDWQEHNKIRPDRLNPSIYRNLIRQKYPDFPLIMATPRSDKKDSSRRLNMNYGDGQGTVPVICEMGDGQGTVPGPSGDGVSKVRLSQNIDSSNNSEEIINNYKNLKYVTPKGDLNNKENIAVVVDALQKIDINEKVATELYAKYGKEVILAALKDMQNRKDILRPGGYLIAILQKSCPTTDNQYSNARKTSPKQCEFCKSCKRQYDDNMLCQKDGTRFDYQTGNWVECEYVND